MIFFAYAIMELGLWGFVMLAVIHFNQPSLYWFAVVGQVLMPTFRTRSKRTDDTNKPEDSNWVDMD